jgi:hypothetical protein
MSQQSASAMRTTFAGRLWSWAACLHWQFRASPSTTSRYPTQTCRGEWHIDCTNKIHRLCSHHCCCRSTLPRYSARWRAASRAWFLFLTILPTKNYCSAAKDQDMVRC